MTLLWQCTAFTYTLRIIIFVSLQGHEKRSCKSYNCESCFHYVNQYSHLIEGTYLNLNFIWTYILNHSDILVAELWSEGNLKWLWNATSTEQGLSELQWILPTMKKSRTYCKDGLDFFSLADTPPILVLFKLIFTILYWIVEITTCTFLSHSQYL